MNLKNATTRFFSLDIVRAAAALGVLVAHTLTYTNLSLERCSFYSSILGYYGVELFFSLSGFLIGSILLQQETYQIKKVLHFWKSRWLRTLPLYYVALIAFYFCTNDTDFSWKFLFFLQGWEKWLPSFFEEAWSLCIEEWFYFLFPISCFLFYAITKKIRHSFFLSLIFLLVVACSIKLYWILNMDYNPSYRIWNRTFRTLVPLRLDAILYGLVLAYIHRFYTIKRNLFFILFLITASISSYFFYNLYNENTTPIIAAYILHFYTGVACTSLIGFVFSIEQKINSLFLEKIKRGITWVSLISYSLYVWHNPVLKIVAKYSSINTWYILIIVQWVVVFLVATMSYFLIEKTFLKFRSEKSNS